MEAQSTYDDYIVEVAASKELSRYRAAEAMSFGQRMLAGPELFDMGIMMMRAGILMDHPGADEATITRHVRERLKAGRRLEGRT